MYMIYTSVAEKMTFSKINSCSMSVNVFPMHMCRGGSRTAATSKKERFVIIVNG